MTPWEIKGRELVSCNCDYGCPCQFNALPTRGNCEAAGIFIVDKGRYGDVDLSGVKFGSVLWWPGPIHEGGGKCLPIVDKSATPAQRDAILKISSGEDTDPGATMFAVFATTMAEVFDPVDVDIEAEIDVEGRSGRLKAGDLLSVVGEPIRNPVTGDMHQAAIVLDHGFEYARAEMGSSKTKTTGPIALEWDGRYAQFAHLHLNNHGVVRA